MGNPLKFIREYFGLSQSDFANRLHVTPASVSRIESGQRPLTDRMIHNIAMEFGVDETWLRTGEGEPFPLPSPEDLALDDAFFALQVDDMDPFRKNLARAALELIAKLPEEAMPALKQFLQDANAAAQNEKDEE